MEGHEERFSRDPPETLFQSFLREAVVSSSAMNRDVHCLTLFIQHFLHRRPPLLRYVGGDVAQVTERRTGTPLRQVRFPGAAKVFSPRVDYQCRHFYRVRTPPYAIACINICMHVKDPVVHFRVRWIMETLKTPSMHRRLCRATLSQLAFPGKNNPNFPWKKSKWDNS